jgi:DNA-binding beta-propeller fold protein YncE
MKNIALFSGITPVALVALVACGSQAGHSDKAQGHTVMPPLSTISPVDKPANDKKGSLRQVQVIPLPGVEGRFDHFAVDVPRQHLFVAALGNDTLEIIDLRSGKRLHSVTGLKKPTGVAFAPELNRIFVASGEGETCEVLDGGTFATLQSIKGLPDADNVRYDSAARQVYVGYGEGALAVLDAVNGQRLGDIRLAGHPESFQLEKEGTRLFVNVPSAGHIAVVDRAKRAVTATWPLNGAQSNFPMALDEAGHRLFIGCRAPARVLVYDTTTGRVEATLPIAGDTDDLFFDAARKCIYVSCGAGFINLFQQQDGGHYEAFATLPTAAGARTALFVPPLQRLYLAVPHRGAQGAEIRAYATTATP